jgi:hypothetical protein
VRRLYELLDNPAGLARVRRWFYAGLGALLLIEGAAPLVVYPDPGHFWFEDLPGWGCLFGLVSCVVIIAFSKLLGKLGLVRRETYYDD